MSANFQILRDTAHIYDAIYSQEYTDGPLESHSSGFLRMANEQISLNVDLVKAVDRLVAFGDAEPL